MTLKVNEKRAFEIYTLVLWNSPCLLLFLSLLLLNSSALLLLNSSALLLFHCCTCPPPFHTTQGSFLFSFTLKAFFLRPFPISYIELCFTKCSLYLQRYFFLNYTPSLIHRDALKLGNNADAMYKVAIVMEKGCFATANAEGELKEMVS